MFAPQRPSSVAISPSIPGLSRKRDAQRDDLALPLQPPHQDGGEHPRIDVRAALKQPNPPAGKSRAVGKNGGEPRGARSLGDGLLQAGQAKNRLLDGLLAYENHVLNQLADHGQRVRAASLDRDAFRERRPSAMRRLPAQGRIGRGVGLDLDADDFDLGPQRLHRRRHAGDETAAADGDNQAVQARAILDEFEPGGALARDHDCVVVRMDQGEAPLGDKPVRVALGFADMPRPTGSPLRRNPRCWRPY